MSFTVIVGAAASKSQRVLIAHNEDVPGRTVPTQRYVKAQSIVPQALLDVAGSPQRPEHVFCADVLGMRDRVMSSVYVNDRAVLVFGGAPVSSFCAEEKASFSPKNQGIEAELLQVAAQCVSADEAVRAAGQLLDRYGYSGTGRNFVFADARTAWVMSVARGHCWAARKIADDEIFMFTDAFAVRTIKLDAPDVLHSPDLPQWAAHFGVQEVDENGCLDFALAFQNEKFINSCVNLARIQQAFIQLTGLYHEAPSAQLLQQKGRAIARCDLQRVLRASSLQTVQERACGQCDAMHIGAADIAGSGTRRSWVMRFDDRPLLSLMWMLQGNPETGVYLPWFVLSGVLPKGYEHPDESRKAAVGTNSVFAFDLNRSYYIYAMIGELCNYNRGLVAGILRMQKRYEQMVPVRVKGVLEEVKTLSDEAAANTLGAFTVAECETMDKVYDSLLTAVDRRTMAVQAEELSRSSSDEVEVVLFGSPEFNVQGLDLDSVAWSVGFDTHPKAPLQAARALAVRFEDVDGDGMVDAVLTFSMDDVAKFAPEGVLVDTYLRGLCHFLRFVAMDPVVFTR